MKRSLSLLAGVVLLPGMLFPQSRPADADRTPPPSVSAAFVPHADARTADGRSAADSLSVPGDGVSTTGVPPVTRSAAFTGESVPPHDAGFAFRFRSGDAALPASLATAPDSMAAYPAPYSGYDPEHTRIRWDHAAYVGGALAVTVIGLHIYQRNAWWKDQRTSFHFVDDDIYALNVDKSGHFFGGAFGSFIGEKSLEWSGMSRDAAAIWGTTMGALFELYVEFEDGFARDWGFSPGDAAGDLLGAGWTLGQHFIPYMEYLQPKFTYYPSQRYLDGLHKGNMIDDYEGQTMWMGIHVHGLLPDAAKRYWPEWLAIAVGVNVREMEDRTLTQRNILIGLDYDMTRIIPGDSWFMRTFKEALNYLHFPAPAIRISPDFVAYGLYFR